jgi:hypothetical protein
MADQEFVKVNPRHSAVPQTSYTLDRVSRIATTSFYILYFSAELPLQQSDFEEIFIF